MTIVTMPDGARVDFGDMPPEQIREKIRTKFPDAAASVQPRSKVGLGEDVGRGAATGLLQGGVDLLGMIVNPGGSMMLDTTAGVQKSVEDLTGRDFYEAQSGAGKLAQAGARGVASGAAGGGAGTLGKIGLNALRFGVAPMVASEAAGQITKGTELETPARLAAGLATGATAAGLSHLKRPQSVKPPSASELIDVGGKEYDAMRQLDVRYRPEAVTTTAENLRYKLYRDGMGPKDAPRTYDILDELATQPKVAPGDTAFISLDNLESARRRLRTAGKNFQNPADKAASSIVRETLDDFVEAADPATVISGPADVAAQLNKNARANYAAGKRSERLNTFEAAAELEAASTYSGLNLENRLRQRAKDIVSPLKPKNQEGYSKDELKAVESVARAREPGSRGPSARNTLRYFGNLAGGGGGLGAGISGSIGGTVATSLLGPWFGIPLGMMVPAAGYGLKKSAENLTRNAFRRADEMVRSRAPYSEHLRSQVFSAQKLTPEARAAMGQASVIQALSERQIPGSAPVVDPRLLPVLRALMPPQ